MDNNSRRFPSSSGMSRFPGRKWSRFLFDRRCAPSALRAALTRAVMSPGARSSPFRMAIGAQDIPKAGSRSNWSMQATSSLSASHPGTLGDDQTAAGRFRLWDRAVDVSFVLNQILNDPKWAPLIDGRRIGFVGHSFGGWTGVKSRWRADMIRRASAPSARLQRRKISIAMHAQRRCIPVQAADAARSFHDARIKAYYIMGSGPGQGFSEESLKAISAPFVVDTAQFDEILEPGQTQAPWRR